MTSRPLPTIAITDLQTGSDYLARLPLTDPQRTASDLQHFFASLHASPPDLETYFRLLEQARTPLEALCEALAKRYLNKPLPLGEREEAAFCTAISLWEQVTNCYDQCGNQPVEDDEGQAHRRRVATLLHRCIHYTGRILTEHQRARREYPRGLWLTLHGYYASAEEWDLSTAPVSDPHEILGRHSSCLAAYVAIILCDMAGSFGLPCRDQTLTQRWALYWAPLVSLHPLGNGEKAPAFVIDLMHDSALRPSAECQKTEALRRLDTRRLALQIGQLRQQLKQKATPAQLALGTECTASQCSHLLATLSRPWAQVRAPRQFKRHASTGITRLCTGFEAMHFYISGREFEQPDNVSTYSRREYETLFAFRHQENPQQTRQIRPSQPAFRLDDWELINQSANGFRLARSASGKSLAHGQLLALCPPDSGTFLLAKATWLMQEKDGGLTAGMLALPGIPTPIAARCITPPEPPGRFERAFLLPAVSSMSTEQSLIVPAGWFRAGSLIEIHTDAHWMIRLTRVLDAGADFEQVAFVRC